MKSDLDAILRGYESLWSDCMGMLGLEVKRDNPDYKFQNSDAAQPVRDVFGSKYFTTNQTWQGPTVDDGYDDTETLKLWDVDVTPSARAWVENERVLPGTGTGTFIGGAGATGTSGSGSELAGEPGAAASGIAGKVAGKDTSSSSLATSGSTGVSATLPAVTSVGDVVFGISLSMDGTYEDKLVSSEVVIPSSVVIEEIAI